MKVLENIISFLQFEMNKPKMYGLFHIICIIIVILLTIILIKKGRNDKKIIFNMSMIMILFEIYKQLSFSYNDGVWKYQWYSFPFQFCSVPMYIALISSLTKNTKIKNASYMFLSTYSLIAGILVMLYPSTVFISEVLINIQTMIHHGFMIVIGMYLILTSKVDLNIKNIKSGFIVFIIMVIIALISNITTYYLNIGGGLELFYISPYHTPELPIFDIIFKHTPYILFLFIYIISFSIGSIIPFMVIKSIKKHLIKR